MLFPLAVTACLYANPMLARDTLMSGACISDNIGPMCTYIVYACALQFPEVVLREIARVDACYSYVIVSGDIFELSVAHALQ